MMKTFDEIYQELKTEDMQEINKLYECVKKEKQESEKNSTNNMCNSRYINFIFS